MTVPRGAIAPDRVAALQRAKKIARLLDSAIGIPGTSIRIGLDPIIGLFPGIGDAAGGVASAYIILIAGRLGAPTSVLLRMALNVAIDTIIGGVPLLGDLFDAGWKANLRNVELLERFVDRPRSARRSSQAIAIAVAVGAVVVVVGLGIGLFYLGRVLLATLR
jgi:hypothetical protein